MVIVMNIKHRNIQEWIKKQYDGIYKIEAEIDGQVYLPHRESHLYQPDVVLRDVPSDNIKYIIEVENDPVRKALIGASILADYCAKIMNQSIKPRLIFIIYADSGIKQIPNFVKRLDIAKQYCENLQRVDIYSEDDFKKQRL